MKKYIQFGCGLSNPEGWDNYDSSPTLRIQKTPIIGWIFKKKLNVVFPNRVKYGDIVQGLNIENESCDGLYCSHVLEHLTYNDLHKALRNSYKYLKNGGTFRLVLPDMEFECRRYIRDLEMGKKESCITLMKSTLLGVETKRKGVFSLLSSVFGNEKHLWMWDYLSLSSILMNIGFKDIRRCNFNDSNDKMFLLVEDETRFQNCLSIECRK